MPTMRVDAHVHGDPADWPGDPRAYIEDCRAQGIEAVVLIEPVERCVAAVERFGDFIIPVARIPMDASSAADVRAALGAGCKGIKFIRPAEPYGDPVYWPLYEEVSAQGAVAVYHTGYLGFRAREERPVHISHMRAAEIDVIARRFPEMRILMAHFSNPWWEEAWKVSWAHENVYADLSGGTAYRRAIRMWADTFAPDGEIIEGSIHRLCFASDVHYFGETHRFQGHVAFYERLFEAIDLPEDVREMVNRGNIRRLFGLDC
jgi:predicted TIM-barrel fold metal-dependent hydrolase